MKIRTQKAHTKGVVLLTVGLALALLLSSVSSTANALYVGGGYASVKLENKDSAWNVIVDGTSGCLRYKKEGPKFVYTFSGKGLDPNTDYSLIYYGDKPNRFVNWGGNYPGALIASGTTDAAGKICLNGAVELNMDLPSPCDINYPDGAKIWLVLTADYSTCIPKLIAWNPTTYLFETHLITYDDTDGEMLGLENKIEFTWPVILDDTWGTMIYTPKGPTFDFVFRGYGLTTGSDYTLIYYPDPWPGTGLICFGSATADACGNVQIAGSVNIGEDLPIPADTAPLGGAKIWLVLSAHVDCANQKMIGWNAAAYLFECFVITYEYQALTVLDYVDIGDVTSEAGHGLWGWGPIEPATSGGNYGGIDDCRCAWSGSTSWWSRYAGFVLTVPYGAVVTQLNLKVLDGLADDSFWVRVNGKNVFHTGQQTGTEDWITHTISLDGVPIICGKIFVTIKATGPAWSGFATYGQLAVDEAVLIGYSDPP